MSDGPAPVTPADDPPHLPGQPRSEHQRAGRREARRATLVQAAMRAIRQHGPDVAMEDIATEAGVSKPILYRNFLDKGDLYMAVSEATTQLLLAALPPGPDADADPRALLRLAIETYLTFIEQEPELYRFVVRCSLSDRAVPQDQVTTNAALLSGTLATIFRDRLRSQGLDPGGAETWAHAGVGMVQAAGDWWLQHRTLSRESLCDYLLMMAWGALDAIQQAGGSPARMLATHGLPTEKPTRRLSAGPIST